MKIEKISDRILFVRFKNEDEMVKTVLRIEEYYENINKFETASPTFTQFIKWYKENVEPKTPYTSYFYGANITGNEIRYFAKAYPAKKQLAKEKEFLDAIKSELNIKSLKTIRKYSIIICPNSKKSSVFQHELAHAIYYMRSSYREKVDKVIKSLNQHELDRMIQYLVEQKYPKDIVIQEINSRLIERVSLKKLFGGLNIRISRRQRQELRQLLQDSLIK
jgi:hypothetical protein